MSYKRGDILFTRPNSWLFDIVRWATSGRFGHVGIVVGSIENHTVIAEAGINGIDINDLKWCEVEKENYSVYRLHGLTDGQRELLVLEALSYIGFPYDKMAWLNFLIGKTWFGKDKEVYCSEMIYRILKDVGIIESNEHPEKISPATLFRLLESKMELVESVTF